MRHDLLVALADGVYERATNGDAGSGSYEYPYSRLQHMGFFILFFFPALAVAVWMLRVYGRFSSKQYGYGVYLIVTPRRDLLTKLVSKTTPSSPLP